MMRLRLSTFVFAVMASPAFGAVDKAPLEADVRKAVQQSLPYLEKEGLAWVKKHNCNSCHQVPFMLWAFQEARAKGIPVDEKKLTEWTDWSLNDSLSRRAWYTLSDATLKKLAADKLPAEILAKLDSLRDTGALTFNGDLTKKLEAAKVPGPIMEKLKAFKGKQFTSNADLQTELEKTFKPEELKENDLLNTLKSLKEKSFVHEEELLAEVAKILTPEELKAQQALLLKHVKMPRKGVINDGGGLDTVAQFLLGGAAKSSSARAKEFLEQAPIQIGKLREASGAWAAAGQLPDREWDKAVADQTTTMWTILALTDDVKQDDATKQMIETSLVTIKEAKVVPNLEWQAVRMLVERRLGKKEKADEFQKDLMDKQNKDGGWSWTLDVNSDAFSTGMALYALTLSGVANNDPAIQQGQKYLIDTQDKNGTWKNLPKKLFKPAKAKKVEPIYIYWGTAWAAIGLSRSLPEGEKSVTPSK